MKSESLVGRTCRSSPRLTSVDLGRRALQKRLNRSRCRLELGLGWTEGTTYYLGAQISPTETVTFGETGTLAVDILSVILKEPVDEKR